jgi:hypothetical protein
VWIVFKGFLDSRTMATDELAQKLERRVNINDGDEETVIKSNQVWNPYKMRFCFKMDFSFFTKHNQFQLINIVIEALLPGFTSKVSR